MNKEETKYSVDYFIEKFSAIPDEKWCINSYRQNDGKKCALGHCGWPVEYPMTKEGLALMELGFSHFQSSFTLINDGLNPNFQQPTPKARILAALKFIKKEKRNEKTKNDTQS